MKERSYRIMVVVVSLLFPVVSLVLGGALIWAHRHWNLDLRPPRPIIEVLLVVPGVLFAIACTVALGNAFRRFKGRSPSWSVRAAVFLFSMAALETSLFSGLLPYLFRFITIFVVGILFLGILLLTLTDKPSKRFQRGQPLA